MVPLPITLVCPSFRHLPLCLFHWLFCCRCPFLLLSYSWSLSTRRGVGYDYSRLIAPASFGSASSRRLSVEPALAKVLAKLDHMNCREARHAASCMRRESVGGMLSGSCGGHGQAEQTSRPGQGVSRSFRHEDSNVKAVRRCRGKCWEPYMGRLVLSAGCARGGRGRGSSTVDASFRCAKRVTSIECCCLFRFRRCWTGHDTVFGVGDGRLGACILQDSRSGRWHFR